MAGRKRKEIRMKVVCKNCGMLRPINEEKSNKNWRVWDTKSPCNKCGSTDTRMIFDEE